MTSMMASLFLFTLTMTVTPGPNNMLLTASGARFGYRRTLPFLWGIVLGIQSQLFLCTLGLGMLFYSFPSVRIILKLIGCCYIIFLAYKIAFSGKEDTKIENRDQPMSFIQGALFQYMNPKAYIMCITAMSVYSVQGETFFSSGALVLISFLFITPFSISLWAGFGTLLKRVMKKERMRRILNIGLGSLTLISVLFIIR